MPSSSEIRQPPHLRIVHPAPDASGELDTPPQMLDTSYLQPKDIVELNCRENNIFPSMYTFAVKGITWNNIILTDSRPMLYITGSLIQQKARGIGEEKFVFLASTNPDTHSVPSIQIGQELTFEASLNRTAITLPPVESIHVTRIKDTKKQLLHPHTINLADTDSQRVEKHQNRLRSFQELKKLFGFDQINPEDPELDEKHHSAFDQPLPFTSRKDPIQAQYEALSHHTENLIVYNEQNGEWILFSYFNEDRQDILKISRTRIPPKRTFLPWKNHRFMCIKDAFNSPESQLIHASSAKSNIDVANFILKSDINKKYFSRRHGYVFSQTIQLSPQLTVPNTDLRLQGVRKEFDSKKNILVLGGQQIFIPDIDSNLENILSTLHP